MPFTVEIQLHIWTTVSFVQLQVVQKESLSVCLIGQKFPKINGDYSLWSCNFSASSQEKQPFTQIMY